MPEVTNTIEASIDVCKENIVVHRKTASRLLIFIILLTILFITGQATVYSFKSYREALRLEYFIKNAITEKVSTLTNSNDSQDNATEIILYGIFVLIFGVLTSFYRFHLKEISKFEHFLIGLHRIRIAANNFTEGFKTEVRTALTAEAFHVESKGAILTKEKKVESPIPGHPTSDLGTYIVNKLFEFMRNQEKQTTGKDDTNA